MTTRIVLPLTAAISVVVLAALSLPPPLFAVMTALTAAALVPALTDELGGSRGGSNMSAEARLLHIRVRHRVGEISREEARERVADVFDDAEERRTDHELEMRTRP